MTEQWAVIDGGVVTFLLAFPRLFQIQEPDRIRIVNFEPDTISIGLDFIEIATQENIGQMRSIPA